MHLFQQRLTDEDYQKFKDEISEVLHSIDKMHELPLLRAWVPCILNHTCAYGPLGHVNSVSILEGVFEKASYMQSGLFQFKRASSSFHLFKGQGVIGEAFLTNQAFFSPNLTSSSNAKDPLSSCAFRYATFNAAIAIPLSSMSIHNADCILEFLLPLHCRKLEEQKDILTALFSNLTRCCKTLRVVAEKVTDITNNSPIFQVPINAVERSGPNDSLFPKENLSEADPKCVMQLLPGSSAQNETCLAPTPSFEPTKVCDANGRDCFSSGVLRERTEGENDWLFQTENSRESWDGKMLPESSDQNEKCQDSTPPSVKPAEVCDTVGLGSLAVSEKSGERYATAEKTINIANSGPNDAAQSTKGKGIIGSAGSKRHWAWKYCTPIPGNSNGVICSFCGQEIKGGGITRFMSHISGSDPSKNVRKCENVPPEVKAEIDHKGKKKITK